MYETNFGNGLHHFLWKIHASTSSKFHKRRNVFCVFQCFAVTGLLVKQVLAIRSSLLARLYVEPCFLTKLFYCCCRVFPHSVISHFLLGIGATVRRPGANTTMLLLYFLFFRDSFSLMPADINFPLFFSAGSSYLQFYCRLTNFVGYFLKPTINFVGE